MITVQQIRAARLLAIGRSHEEVAALLGCHVITIHNWKKNPEFVDLIEGLSYRHAELMQDMLAEGEMEAVATMRGALDAENSKGLPLWKIRTMAAKDLLDRQGQRGKATEKTTNAFVAVGGDLGEALTRALRDPAVRRWAVSQPKVLAALPAEIIECTEPQA